MAGLTTTEFTVDEENLEVRTARVFNTTRQRLWHAATDPNQIPRWWGPAKYETRVDKHDFTVGGEWRFVHKDKDGEEFAFSGVFKEIVEHERVTETFEFEPMPGHVLVETMTLEELEPGKTRMTSTAKYANIEDLQGMVQSGMEGGQRESYERLAELVKE
jgi:uncharacterized protein YndB with AHSA1/START domain